MPRDTLTISPSVVEYLQRQGVSFPAIREELTTSAYFAFWREVASRNTKPELQPIDIAFLLGFAEPNSFVRAFRSWERTTPLRWRAARS